MFHTGDYVAVTVLGSCNRTGLRKPEISLRSSRGQDLQWQKVTQAWRKGYASLAEGLRKPGERVARAWRKCYASLAKVLRKPGEGCRLVVTREPCSSRGKT